MLFSLFDVTYLAQWAHRQSAKKLTADSIGHDEITLAGLPSKFGTKTSDEATEGKDRRELGPYCVLPSLAGGEYSPACVIFTLMDGQ